MQRHDYKVYLRKTMPQYVPCQVRRAGTLPSELRRILKHSAPPDRLSSSYLGDSARGQTQE